MHIHGRVRRKLTPGQSPGPRPPWVRETLLLDVPHRQVVFTIPKTLRIFFKFRRRLLGELCRSAVKTLTVYFEALTGDELVPDIIVAIQTFGNRISFHPPFPGDRGRCRPGRDLP